MWISPLVISGHLLRLEPLELRHAPDLFAAADPELFRHTPQQPPVWSVAGFELEIAKVNAFPNVVALAVILQSTNQAIGRSTYMEIAPAHRAVEIGRTWIARPHHGTRINPELKFLMLRHAFETLDPPAIRVQLTTGGTNLHSQAAIAKLGATSEGTLRHNRIVPSGPDPAGPTMRRDTVFYSILLDEWPRVKLGLLARMGHSGPLP